MRCFAILIAVGLLTGCAGPPSQVVGSTPAMITICQAPGDSWQTVLDMAQLHCADQGKAAELSAQGDRCSRGSGTILGYVTHFRCTAR